jgi:molybdopterin biosynthesis enzyme
MVGPVDTSQRVTRLAPLTDALARISVLASPVAVRTLDVSSAVGRVLAGDAVAPMPQPKTATALRDGYAVLAESVADAGAYAPMALTTAPDWVEAGEPVPGPADAVLEPEAVVVTGGLTHALLAVGSGDGVLAAGSDAAQGEILRRAGECLRGIDAAILHAVGASQVAVRVPHVRIICANPSVSAANDFVAPLLVGAIRKAGACAQIVRIGEEDLALERAIMETDADAIVTIGGTGRGRRDQTARILAALGGLQVHGIGLTPGTTAGLGSLVGRPVLLLPGRLDAAVAGFLVLGGHLLARLGGRRSIESGIEVVVGRKIVSTVGLAEVVLVRHGATGVEPVAREAFPLAALTRAQGWILVPANSEGLAAGARTTLWTLP